jgi:dTMP kinase
MCPETELGLYFSDRAQHLREVVWPALHSGKIVVSDRFTDSTLAYQGYGRGLDLAELRAINDWAIGGLWPARVVLLDAPDEVLTNRLHGRELDRFERAGKDFHDRVVTGFRAMAAADPDHWIVVDAAGEPDTVAARILAAVTDTVSS